VKAVPRRNLAIKRGCDLLLLLPILAIALPLSLLIWLGYRLSTLVFGDDRGEIVRRVYRQAGGRAIPIHKFRVAKQAQLRERARELDDERVEWLIRYLPAPDQARLRRHREHLLEDAGGEPTRVGRILKQVYLDELPQVFDVLLGHLSFVGPRPLPFSDPRTRPDPKGRITLDGETFDYGPRDLLPGGLTGLYQTNKDARALRDYATFRKEGMALDRRYYELLRDASPWQVAARDVRIVLQTLRIVAEHKGA
jgi:lipopolysaccharide/colanic/teichoic acid biosynthesis glycosyltransferase